MKPKFEIIKVFVALCLALLGIPLGIVLVALAKAMIPIFRVTDGTWFESHVQDPILYLFFPLLCSFWIFMGIMGKFINKKF